MTIDELIEQWSFYKDKENYATSKRREIEDKIIELEKITNLEEGVKTFGNGNKLIKVTTRITRKVDKDLLQELALEAGLEDHLSVLFRWSAEINAAAWSKTDESVTKPLLGAITSKSGRPSFSINIKE